MENQNLTMSDEQKTRLGDKYISEGTSVTDNDTQTKYRICKIDTEGILLEQASSFSNHPKAKIKVGFDEFLKKYDEKQISIAGYAHEVPDQIILHQVVRDIVATGSISSLNETIGELATEEVEFKSGGVVGTVKLAKNGYVRDIKNQFGKKIMTVKTDDMIFQWYPSDNTYKSTTTASRLNKASLGTMQVMKSGGIANQYEGLTLEEIWKAWTPKQRIDFLSDHDKEINERWKAEGNENTELNSDKWYASIYSELPTAIVKALAKHATGGQYKKAGKIKKSENDLQEQGRKMVGNEVHAVQSSLVEKLLSNDIIPIDDIQNYYRPAEEGEDEEQPQEILEWWLISDWLKEKLLEQSEPIIDNEYGTWWGRTTSGQAIYMDGVIRTILEEINSRRTGGPAGTADEKGYQGWKNYETWNVKLWLDNDSGSHEYWDERATEIAKTSKKEEHSTKKQVAVRHLADELKEYHEENNPLADQASTYTDLLGSALDNVDWREIAENLLSEKMKYGGEMKSGGEAGREFKYLRLTPKDNGLEVSLTAEGLEKVKEDGLTFGNASDYFEDIQGNSEFRYHPDMGQSGFGMTQAEGITDGYYPSEDAHGEWETKFPESAKVYWFPNYQIQFWGDILKEEGVVFFNDGDMKQGGKVDVTKNYYRFRQASPKGVTECAVPQWGQKVADSIKKGAKITTCKKDGKWMIQSILIPKQGVKSADAKRMSEEIKTKFTTKKKALGGVAETCSCDDIKTTIEGLETLRDTTEDANEKKRYQELINDLN